MVLIVTNGDSAADRIRRLGLDADVLPWRDVLHDGPVRDVPGLRGQSAERAAFLAPISGRPHDDVARGLAERDERFLTACAGETVELWFEHDLYDQLQLAQILDAAMAVAATDVRLVQTDAHLTQLAEAAFAALVGSAVVVSKDVMVEYAAAWTAFRAPDPSLLEGLREVPMSAGHLAAAVERILQEYPDRASGLAHSMELALRPLLDGPARIGRLFHGMQQAEDAAFMGDLSFGWLVDDLANCEAPVLQLAAGPPLAPFDRGRDWFAQEVVLTTFGRDVLAGEANHVERNGVDRWIGGVRLTPDRCFWRST